MNRKTGDFKDRHHNNTLEDILSKIDDMSAYKDGEKLDKDKERSLLEALLNNINIKLKSTNRPAFEPDEDISLHSLNDKWGVLGGEEVNRDDWLDKERKKQERLKALLSKFNDKADKLEKWIAEKEEYLKTNESVNSIAEAKNKLGLAEGFTNEYKQSEPRLQQVQKLGHEIAELSPNIADEINNRLHHINNNWNGLGPLHHTKIEDLEEKLRKQEEMERLRLLFANKAKIYNKFIKDSVNVTASREFGDTLQAVEDFGQKVWYGQLAHHRATNQGSRA